MCFPDSLELRAAVPGRVVVATSELLGAVASTSDV